MKQNSNKMQNIENQIKNIYENLNLQNGDSYDVALERPKRGASCAGFVNLYCKGDTNRNRKPAKMYAFYPSIYRPNTIGSIAIYGDDLTKEYDQAIRFGHIFGMSIGKITTKVGRRAFLDIEVA